MTISKEQAIKEARECFADPDGSLEMLTPELHAYANRMYQLGAASKELEVARLRSQAFGALMVAAASHEDTAIYVKHDQEVRNAAESAIEWTRKQAQALSTPLSTEALDEYVAEKVRERESKIATALADTTAAMLEFKNKWIDASRKLAAAEERFAKCNEERLRIQKSLDNSKAMHEGAANRWHLAEERVKELERPEKTCKWTPWADSGLIYDTECGHGWMFEAGDIADNGVKFCPYCAGKIDAAIERSE